MSPGNNNNTIRMQHPSGSLGRCLDEQTRCPLVRRRLMFAILHRHQSLRRCPTRSQRIIIEIELLRLSTPLNLEASRLCSV